MRVRRLHCPAGASRSSRIGLGDDISPSLSACGRANTDAIADLALENFVEMRDRVADPRFLFKKKVELALEAKYPRVFVPKYAMVTFQRIPVFSGSFAGTHPGRDVVRIVPIDRSDRRSRLAKSRIDDSSPANSIGATLGACAPHSRRRRNLPRHKRLAIRSRDFRERFHIPKMANGSDCVYLCGHSLGLQPKSTRNYVEQELQDWARLGVEAHFQARNPWMPYHEILSGPFARLVGALPIEVVAMNSLTVNLHLMMVSFYRPTAQRNKILIEANAFPSDQYAVKSQIQYHGYDPAEALDRSKTSLRRNLDSHRRYRRAESSVTEKKSR